MTAGIFRPDVLPFWLAIIVLPGWRGTSWLMRSQFPVLVLALVYAVLVVPRLMVLGLIVASPRLSDIVALLGTPEGSTIAWVHFLAFDLFVGRWVYIDSRARRISPWLMAPVLLVILLFAPLGYLAYRGVAALHEHSPQPLLRRLVLLAWQALRGESVVAPDTLTLSALGALFAIAGAIGATTAARGLASSRADGRASASVGAEASSPVDTPGTRPQSALAVRGSAH